MFRFTIRDLLWLMVVAGLAAGWWREHEYFAARARRSELRAWREHVATQYKNGVASFLELARANVKLDDAEIRAADTIEDRIDAEQRKSKHLAELTTARNR
jgi:hypothetical protein